MSDSTTSPDERSTGDRFKEFLGISLLKGSAWLPLPVSRSLGAVVGWLAYVSRNRMYQVTRENLTLCFPDLSEAERRRLTRASLRETGKMLLETGAVWLKDQAWLKRHVLKIHNLELLEQGLSAGKGVIMLGPHLGNWEVLGLFVSGLSRATFLYQPPDNPRLEQIIRDSREKAGAHLVPTNRKGVLALLKSLKAGGFTGILPDQVPDAAGGEFAPFYDVPALTMTLVNNLRQRSGCAVFAGYAERVPGGFEIHFIEAAAGIDADDPAVALTALNKTVERCVNQIPAQYQWEYKRFRKQPAGMPKRYKKKQA